MYLTSTQHIGEQHSHLLMKAQRKARYPLRHINRSHLERKASQSDDAGDASCIWRNSDNGPLNSVTPPLWAETPLACSRRPPTVSWTLIPGPTPMRHLLNYLPVVLLHSQIPADACCR